MELIRKDINGIRHYHDEANTFCYPSITTVLSATKPKKDLEGLQVWRDKLGAERADKRVEEACRHGTAVHALMEQKLTDIVPEVEILLKDKMAFRKGLKVIGDITEVVGVEIPLVSHELKVAGTSDGVVLWNNELSIIDFKTMRQKKKDEWMNDYFIQMAFYGYAYGEMNNTRVENIIIIGMPELGPGFISKHKLTTWENKMKNRLKSYYNE